MSYIVNITFQTQTAIATCEFNRNSEVFLCQDLAKKFWLDWFERVSNEDKTQHFQMKMAIKSHDKAVLIFLSSLGASETSLNEKYKPQWFFEPDISNDSSSINLYQDIMMLNGDTSQFCFTSNGFTFPIGGTLTYRIAELLTDTTNKYSHSLTVLNRHAELIINPNIAKTLIAYIPKYKDSLNQKWEITEGYVITFIKYYVYSYDTDVQIQSELTNMAMLGRSEFIACLREYAYIIGRMHEKGESWRSIDMMPKILYILFRRLTLAARADSFDYNNFHRAARNIANQCENQQEQELIELRDAILLSTLLDNRESLIRAMYIVE